MKENYTIQEINPITFCKILLKMVQNDWHINKIYTDPRSGFTAYIAELDKYEI